MEFANPNSERDTILLLKRWLENKNHNRSFADYFVECGYDSIGICDAGDIGKILYDEIKSCPKIKVKWFIDKNAEGIGNIEGKPVRMMKDIFNLPAVDIVCISPIYDYESLSNYLFKDNPQISTLSLKDAAYEI